VEHPPGALVPTCPNGHPLDAGPGECRICAAERLRKRRDDARATAGALILLDAVPIGTARQQTRQIRNVLTVVSLGLLTASISLLAVRGASRHATKTAGIPAAADLTIPLPPQTSTTTTVRPTVALGCPQLAYAPLDAAQAARCLYLAWRTGDQRGTQFYASVPAVETLFSRIWQPPDRAFGGCDQPSGPATGLSRQTCHYRGLTMEVDCSAERGCSVVAAEFSG
jgi:hypothetical protein